MELLGMFIASIISLCVGIVVNQHTIIRNQKYIIRLNQKSLQKIEEESNK